MKCENCGKNEVAFVYQSSVNGHVREAHLCSECAEKLGYTRHLSAQRERMLRDLFGGGSLFAPWGGVSGWLLESPFEDLFAQMPALGAEPDRRAETQTGLVEQAEQDRFSRMRELNAKKQELKDAVRQEDFERAAQLRDQIRDLEPGREEERGC